MKAGAPDREVDIAGQSLPVHFMGLDFVPMGTAAAARKLADEASTETPFGYVVTPNVDHMVRLARDPSLRYLYADADLLLNDSRILELLARLDGHRFAPSPGADVVQTLFEEYIDKAEPIVVIGCTHDDIIALEQRYGLQDVRWHDAPMGLRRNPDAVDACAQFMADNPARFHFLCLGSPQQEMVAWAAKQREDVVGIGLCCGASLDFLSGRTSRAPRWMRAARLEWLHRLASEPKRLGKRYLLDGPTVLRVWWKHRGSR